MLQLECGNKHTINYNDSCCLKHLIEMSHHAEAHTLTHKYSKLLLKTLNHYFKLDSLSFESLKLETAKIFLDIMSKYISHYYFLNKYEYSKLLVKIALKSSEETLFREHPEIIIRRGAIYNNLACVYERTGSYTKAIQYTKLNLKFANGNLDKALVYNNIAIINVKLKDKTGTLNAMRSCFELFKEEAKQMMAEFFKFSQSKDTFNIANTGSNGNISLNNQNRFSLISFLYFNYATYLQNANKESEASEIFRKGYEFSLNTLSEYHIIIGKFANKIHLLSSVKVITFKDSNKRSTIDSKYDSDLDYTSIVDNNITINRSTKNIKNCEDRRDSNKLMSKKFDSFASMKVVEKKNTMSTGYNVNNGSYQLNEMNELKLKMDILLQKFDKIETENLNAQIKIKKESMSKEKDTTTDSKKSLIKGNEKLKKLFEPAIRKLIKGDLDNVSQKSLENINRKTSLQFSENLINDLVNEFEAEAIKENIFTKKNSRFDNNFEADIKNLDNSLNKTSSKNRLINLNLTTDFNSGLNRSMSVTNKKRSIKDLFSKVVSTSKLEAIEAKSSKATGGLFSQMIESMVNETHEDSKKPVVNNILKRDNSIINTNTSAINKPKSAFVDLMDIQEELNTTPVTYDHNINLIKSDLIKNSSSVKVNPNCGVNVIMDNTDDNYEFTTLVFSKSEEDINNAKKFDNNLIMDKTEDKYNIKPLVQNTKINVILDKTDDNYKFENLVFTKTRVDKKEKENKIQINKNSEKNIKINVIIDKTEDDDKYVAETFYIKDERAETKSNKDAIVSNKKKKLSSEMIKEKENDIVIKIQDLKNIIKDSDLLTNKKKKEIDIKKYFEGLIINHKEISKPPVISILRELNNELYKITISYGVKDTSKGIYLRLYKSVNGDGVSKYNSTNLRSHLAENFISYDKLKSFSSKIAIYNSLPDNLDLYSINTLDLYLENIFIYHCYLFSKESSIQLGVLTRPLGICFNRAYEFTFLRTSCIIDIFILQTKEIKFFIYNKNNDFMSISFNWVLDNQCFHSLFQELEPTNFSVFEEERVIRSYKTIDDRHLTKSGFITEIIIAAQKIFKHKTNDENLKFDSIAINADYSVYKTIIKDDFKMINLFTIYYSQSNKNTNYEVDFYTLKKVQIKNEQTSLHLNYSISHEQLSKIIGYEMSQINHLITDRDRLQISYILLNSINLNKNISEDMTRKELDTNIKLKIEPPTSFFHFSFVQNLGSGFNPIIFTLEYLFYNPLCQFYLLSISDSHGLQTYSKIIPSQSIQMNNLVEPDHSKASKLIYESLFNIEDNMTQKMSKLNFKKGVVDYFFNWNKQEFFNLFEPLETLLLFTK